MFSIVNYCRSNLIIRFHPVELDGVVHLFAVLLGKVQHRVPSILESKVDHMNA